MLSDNFKHKYWFIGQELTVKEFLDYVLTHDGDFGIKQKSKVKDLFDNPDIDYYLCDGRYTYKLGYQERNYLAKNSKYFSHRLPKFIDNYMNVIISANNEPIKDNISYVEFSR